MNIKFAAFRHMTCIFQLSQQLLRLLSFGFLCHAVVIVPPQCRNVWLLHGAKAQNKTIIRHDLQNGLLITHEAKYKECKTVALIAKETKNEENYTHR
jgi:hypothetical protein